MSVGYIDDIKRELIYDAKHISPCWQSLRRERSRNLADTSHQLEHVLVPALEHVLRINPMVSYTITYWWQ